MLRERGWVTDMTDTAKNLRAFKGMTVRNIKVYANDKLAIILSMLTQIIVLMLFLLFIKNSYVDGINETLGALKNKLESSDINALVNSWLISGVTGTAVVTVALNTLSMMVHDKAERIDYDYTAASVKGRTVVLSYFSGAVISTIITSSILLTAGLVFIAATGGFFYTFADIMKIYALVILGSISSTLVLMAFTAFFKKPSTLSSFGILVSASIGFIVGAYMPVSEFGEQIQTVVNLVPGSQITGMMRNVLMQPAIDNIDQKLAGLDSHSFAQSMSDTFALKLNIFGNEVSMNFMMIYTLSIIALFLVLNIVTYKISSKRK